MSRSADHGKAPGRFTGHIERRTSRLVSIRQDRASGRLVDDAGPHVVAIRDMGRQYDPRRRRRARCDPRGLECEGRQVQSERKCNGEAGNDREASLYEHRMLSPCVERRGPWHDVNEGVALTSRILAGADFRFSWRLRLVSIANGYRGGRNIAAHDRTACAEDPRFRKGLSVTRTNFRHAFHIL